MIEIIDKKDCTGCTSCYSSCPLKCIKMKYDEEGFLYPLVDKTKCIDCGICLSKCPVLIDKHQIQLKGCYLAKNKREYITETSSSGGIFHEIAEFVLNEGGIIYGAYYDNQTKKTYHINISNLEEIKKIKKSKYMQSELDDTFKEIKKYLNSNKLILFVGTPCQTYGLKTFLNEDYTNLITVDFVCHGVPSSYVWNKYLSGLEKKESKKIKEVYFRFKDSYTSWYSGSIKIEFEDHSLTEPLSKNKYLLNFNESLYLRPSCYHCQFKGLNRCSDITLADAWGVNNYDCDFYDEKGVSFVTLNSDKGKMLFDNIGKNIIYKETSIEFLKKYNSQYIESANQNSNRKPFFDALSTESFDSAISSFGKKPTNRYIFYLKALLKKLKTK